MSIVDPAAHTVPDNRWRTGLQWISLGVALEVALHSFIVKEPLLTLAGAGLWLGAGFFWTRRGGKGGPLLIGVLALFEIGASLFLSEEFAADGEVATWILAVHVVLVTAALLLAVATVVTDGRPSSGPTRPAPSRDAGRVPGT